MGDKHKVLCKLAKDDYPEKHPEDYISLVKDGKYFCEKCGRVAHDERNLCKAKKLK